MPETDTGISESIEKISILLREKRDFADELKKSASTLELRVQQAQRSLKKVQQAQTYAHYTDLLQSGNQQCTDLIEPIKELEIVVSKHPFHLYHYAWENEFQQAIAVVIKAIWLTSKQLPTPSEVAEQISIPFESEVSPDDGNVCLHFSAEDYLHGVVSLVNDLPEVLSSIVLAYLLQSRKLSKDEKNNDEFQKFYRLTAISIVGIRETIDQSLTTMYSLDLINGRLRRRTDSLKYSAKKVDEIVFDLTVRGLLPVIE